MGRNDPNPNQPRRRQRRNPQRLPPQKLAESPGGWDGAWGRDGMKSKIPLCWRCGYPVSGAEICARCKKALKRKRLYNANYRKVMLSIKLKGGTKI